MKLYHDNLLVIGTVQTHAWEENSRNTEIWSGVIDRHGVGKMNLKGLRLLTICVEHDLIISNTYFRMRKMYKVSWIKSCSHQWHLFDYIIYRRRDISNVKRPRAMGGAQCSTDPRLILSDVSWKAKPKIRRQKNSSKKLNLAALQDFGKRKTTRPELVLLWKRIRICPFRQKMV